jgi:hypothetical protein
MDAKSAQIATICGCIDHCFAYSIWCEDFAQHVDPDDMVMGLLFSRRPPPSEPNRPRLIPALRETLQKKHLLDVQR